MTRRVCMCDITLRDGEHTLGVACSAEKNCAIARLLDESGVQRIECGSPGLGGKEQQAVLNLAYAQLAAEIVFWNRAIISNIEHSMRGSAGAVSLSLPVSKFQIGNKAKTPRVRIPVRLGDVVDSAVHRSLACAFVQNEARA